MTDENSEATLRTLLGLDEEDNGPVRDTIIIRRGRKMGTKKIIYRTSIWVAIAGFATGTAIFGMKYNKKRTELTEKQKTIDTQTTKITELETKLKETDNKLSEKLNKYETINYKLKIEFDSENNFNEFNKIYKIVETIHGANKQKTPYSLIKLAELYAKDNKITGKEISEMKEIINDFVEKAIDKKPELVEMIKKELTNYKTENKKTLETEAKAQSEYKNEVETILGKQNYISDKIDLLKKYSKEGNIGKTEYEQIKEKYK